MAVDVDHAERDLLFQRLPLEAIQQVQAGVGHLEVELVHRQLVEELKDLVIAPVAGVKDRLRPQALRHRADSLDQQRQLIEARRERGLVDLDDFRARGFEADRLLMEQSREREARVLPRPGQLALGGFRPRTLKVFGLRERTDARRQETGHPATPTFLAAADRIRSFSRARSRGRNSRPFEGDRNDAFRLIRSFRPRTFLATSAGSSFFVLRASTRPRTSGFSEPCFAIADNVAAPWTRSRPIASTGVSMSSSKIFETSPKYVKRVRAAAPLRARMRSSPSTASGRSSGCRVRIGSSIWM